MWDKMGGDKPRRRDPKRFISKVLASTRSFFRPSGNLFEAMNFRYFGPIDGHDLHTLTEVLQDLKTIQGPKLLHIVTTKGKGLRQAEQSPIVYHAPGAYEPRTGKLLEKSIPEPMNPAPVNFSKKVLI